MIPLHFSYISRYVIDGNSNMSLYVAFFSLDISRICAKEKKNNCCWWCFSVWYGCKGSYGSDNRNCNYCRVVFIPLSTPVPSGKPPFLFSPRRKVRLLRENRCRRRSTSWCRSPSLQLYIKRWCHLWNFLPVGCSPEKRTFVILPYFTSLAVPIRRCWSVRSRAQGHAVF